MTDINAYVQQQTEILNKLSELDKKDFETKREFIIRLKEVTKPLIEAGYYENVIVTDLASFIYKTLEEYDINYPRNDAFYSLFTDDEKKIQYNSTKSRETDTPPVNEGIEGKIEAVERSIGRGYDQLKNEKLETLESISQKNLSHLKSFYRKLASSYYFTEKFERVFGSVEEAEKLDLPKKTKQRVSDLVAMYHASQLLISEMEDSINSISDSEIREMQALQAMTSRDIDERNKLSNWEKLMIILAMKAGGIAKNQCAKLKNIDKKHITNNIMPEKCPIEPYSENKHHRYISWFKAIKIKLGGKDYTFDISRWFDEQIERKKLDLEFKPLVIDSSI